MDVWLGGIIKLRVVRSDLKEGWIEFGSGVVEMAGVKGIISISMKFADQLIDVVGSGGCLHARRWEGGNGENGGRQWLKGLEGAGFLAGA